ncbi:hypothetical protein J2Z42_000862 [Clostridium algifaecis]|uniref:DUF4351 domain-containing protein n=1 Tax=Clostridium algifaecis TaxID=1472040 RepID=A0ABS4KQ81_9CLOT|nr:DUF4351 domain-containing protein [Clostridium algifaecis]MBP2032197.1 hypothetical protein [Clostridium algifaecis]
MDYNKYEDTVFKKAMEIFQQSAVDFFNINTKIIAPAEIEIKNIEIKTKYMDYLFYTEDGNYLHFEFQTTNKKDDIKRFLYYDASLFYREKRKIRTIVIYSSDIENSDECVDAGTIKYRVEPFYMKNINGDEKLEYLNNKICNKEKLTKDDILSITFLPLMNGEGSKSERAIKSLDLAENIKDRQSRLDCMSMLYVLLDKFGDLSIKKKLKERISMTEIGRMIRDEGREEGRSEGKSELIIKQLIKKFKKLPDGYAEKIKTLSSDSLEVIATDIFDMDSIEDLEKYF